MSLRVLSRLPRPLRFLIAGGLNTLFGYSVFAVSILAGAPPSVALLCATILGVAFNYLTTSRYVFQKNSFKFVFRFAAVYALLYIVNLVAIHAIIDAGIGPLPAQAMATPPIVVLSYILMRRFVFGRVETGRNI